MKFSTQAKRRRRAARIRSRLVGTDKRPRLTVFRSSKHITAQIIDDGKGVTLASSTDALKVKGTKTERAAIVGRRIAEKGLKIGIAKVVFDRGSYKYHGRVAALANAARSAGLEF